jgi:hypothetical protein
MISTREHPEFDVLNDYVDGWLDPRARAEVTQHLEACDSCRREHDELRKLLDSTRLVPESVLPSEDLWAGIRSSIDLRKEVMLPVSTSVERSAPGRGRSDRLTRPWWAYRSVLSAAAVVLVIASSGLTALVLRVVQGSTDRSAVSAPGQAATGQVLPIGFRRAENEYLQTIAELRSTLQAQRSVLRPETVAAVERSLSVVDSAIEEARAALLSDPSNATLVDLLTASYERKVDLLRRATDLGART